MCCFFIVHVPDSPISPSLLTHTIPCLRSPYSAHLTPVVLLRSSAKQSKRMALGRSSTRKRESSRSRSRRQGLVALIATIYCSCTGLVDASLGRGNTAGSTTAAAVASGNDGGFVVIRTCQQARAWIESESKNTNNSIRTVGATEGRRPAQVTFALQAGEMLDNCLGEVSELAM